ncbi:MFS transporter [Achromobacter ruhlandii]|uniref:MFS transporter n=1 Tax=Achromobacter ruhlandii TaxID=72557 RepID=UPI0014671C2B|nr:MFS transporter [Achromobacter ruhlandii]CAB3844706.1 Purine ribonucleoside efflux pump NepI [Achromobacter ruhlandii]
MSCTPPLPAGACPLDHTEGLPLGKLLALALAGFITIMTETVPAGLLPQIGQGLGVSEALAGQLVTLFAAGSVLAAIPIIAATRGWNRRPLLLLAIGGLCLFNVITALSTDYVLTLAARFGGGMAAGLLWGLLAGYARRMVATRQQGRALAVVGAGQPLALCLGVPAGAWLGSLMDWRGVFWLMAAVSLTLVIWVRAAVPDFAGQTARRRLPIARTLMLAGIRPILFVLFTWILAHNVLYTYIAPYLIHLGRPASVDTVLLVFGASAVAGLLLTGMLVDRCLRLLTLLSLTLFAVTASALGLAGAHPAVLMAGVALWGLSFGGAPTLLQTALADTAGEHSDVAQSMLVTIFNLGIASGGVLGGALLDTAGAGSFAWTVTALAVIALLAAWSARGHAFRPGRRR